MYKAKISDVKMLLKWGQNNDKVREMIENNLQPSGHLIANYCPSGANWAWEIGIYTIDGLVYELLIRFGTVEGGRRIYTGASN